MLLQDRLFRRSKAMSTFNQMLYTNLFSAAISLTGAVAAILLCCIPRPHKLAPDTHAVASGCVHNVMVAFNTPGLPAEKVPTLACLSQRLPNRAVCCMQDQPGAVEPRPCPFKASVINSRASLRPWPVHTGLVVRGQMKPAAAFLQRHPQALAAILALSAAATVGEQQGQLLGAACMQILQRTLQ